MTKKFISLFFFLSACIFCNADNVEYEIILLETAGKEFNLSKNNPVGPNTKGQTIGYEFTEDGINSWIDDPVKGRKILRKPRQYYLATPLFITNSGYVVGGEIYSFCIWNPKGKFEEFFPPSGKCRVKAVNNQGEVVFNDYFRKGSYYAHILTKDKEIIELGSLGWFVSSGKAINDFSQVVGSAEVDRRKPHAFIWDKTNGMRDLTSLIPQDSGWSELIDANYINNEGLIVGEGIYQGESCEFLLIPKDER